MTDKRSAYESPLELASAEHFDERMPRPVTITVGAILVVLRVIAGGVWLFAFGDVAESSDGLETDVAPLDPEVAEFAFWTVVGVIGGTLLVEVLLAFLVWRGVNWARIAVMAFATISIATAFIAWWSQGQEITVRTTLVTLALDILVLLALSSRSARAFARRRERHRA